MAPAVRTTLPSNVRFRKFRDVQLGRDAGLHVIAVRFRHIHVDAKDINLRQLEKLLRIAVGDQRADIHVSRRDHAGKGAVTRWNDCRYFSRSTLATAASRSAWRAL